ncbi:MAG: hypothetical protein WD717_06095 [Nitrosarchaeum sp.]
MEINQWAESLTKKVFDEWKNKFSFWNDGFKVFYSPVRLNPKVMIISYNPGGNRSSFESEDYNRFLIDDFSSPKANLYIIKNYLMANKMKDFFQDSVDELEQSVVFPVIFFRSKNKRYWRQFFPNEKRILAEQFCFEIVKEIITTIKPKKLLIIGFETLDILQKHVTGKLESIEIKSVNYGKNNERLYQLLKLKDIPVFVIRHPTGSRIRKQDWLQIKKRYMKLA